jgi:hypothetical protein
MLFVEAAFPIKARAQDASKEKGNIITLREDGNTYLYITPAKAHGLKDNILKLNAIILETPLLKPPRGCNVEISYNIEQSTNDELPWLKLPNGSTFFELVPLYFENGKLKQASEGGSDLSIRINDFSDIIKSPYFTALGEANYPEPIFLPLRDVEVDSSDNGSVVIKYQTGFPVHVITNGKKIFVPFTQRQYMHFKVVRDQKTLQDDEKQYNSDNENLHSMKKEFAELSKKKSLTDFEKMRLSTDSFSLKSFQKLVDADKESVNVLAARLKHDQQSLNTLDPNAPAFINIDQPGTFNDDLIFPDIADKNDPGKIELWTINPDYFNPQLPLSAIQLMVVTYRYHPQMTTENMKAMAKKLFETIDYNKLKTLVER